MTEIGTVVGPPANTERGGRGDDDLCLSYPGRYRPVSARELREPSPAAVRGNGESGGLLGAGTGPGGGAAGVTTTVPGTGLDPGGGATGDAARPDKRLRPHLVQAQAHLPVRGEPLAPAEASGSGSGGAAMSGGGLRCRGSAATRCKSDADPIPSAPASARYGA